MSMIRQCLQTLGHKSDPFKLRSKQSEYLSEAGRGVLLQRLLECIRRGDSASIVIAQMMTQLQPDSFHVWFQQETDGGHFGPHVKSCGSQVVLI